jgi:RNA polymerase sigma factor for flagellar operon FliA
MRQALQQVAREVASASPEPAKAPAGFRRNTENDEAPPSSARPPERGVHALSAARQLDLASHQQWVTRMAHRLASRLPSCVQVDDLVQAGMIGLMDAMTRYDESQGATLETFAASRVQGAMLDELRANDWVPRGVRRSQRRIESAISRAEQELGRAASEGEIAEAMGVPLGEYQLLLRDARGAQLIHYDEFDGDDAGESYLGRVAACEECGPGERYEDRCLREAVVAAIENLPERERQLMGLYYDEELTMREIAEVFGVTESRVCQLHTQAVARLRVAMDRS